MAYIYSFRLGGEDLFKVGKTTNSLELRCRQLQTGCPHTLALFDFIEIGSGADALAGEHFIKQRYAERVVRPRSEIFRFTAEEMFDVLAAARKYVADLPEQHAAQEAVSELSALVPSDQVVPATEELKSAARRLRELQLNRHQLENRVKDVDAEITRLEAVVKIAIGSASGIDGIATWTMGKSRGKFNPEKVQAADPQLYEQYLVPQFDAARFRKEHTKDYSSYMETTPVRVFQLVDEPEQPL